MTLRIILFLALTGCGVTIVVDDGSETEDTDVQSEDTDLAEIDDSVDSDTIDTEDTDTVETEEPGDSAEPDDTDDESTTPSGTDHDRDGYVEGQGRGEDCDDDNDAVHPGATEIVADGTDQNCDGGDCIGDEDFCVFDADNDGYDESVLFEGNNWVDHAFDDVDAEILENGDGTECGLTSQEVRSNGLGYIISFDGIGNCTMGVTLIIPMLDPDDDLWWQNKGFCEDQDLDSWCYETSPGNWMVGIEWDGIQLAPFNP